MAAKSYSQCVVSRYDLYAEGSFLKDEFNGVNLLNYATSIE